MQKGPQKSFRKQFKAVIERDEDGYFVASVPVLPGCHTQAKTLPELTRRIQDAIQLCLNVSRTNPQYRKRTKRFAYEPSFVGMEVVSV
ncbi:MAG: type II toxin-antitoxin system HicB family antitoxin [Candidatus Niyogibacteria bacterium]|nr:type II toxin-antitoxin system HicB family antitoxin [Candidatus Niyogibacteria bacterium]